MGDKSSETILVSVILPTYNRAGTILRACSSVLGQSHKNLELIVVDDGSTDNTKEIVESIDDNRIRYVYQTNSGACVARNHGISLAQGEYIAFQDSDDSWRANKLERQLNTLLEEQVDVVFCGLNRHDYSEKEDNCIYPQIDSGKMTEKLLVSKSLVSTQSILGKRKVFEDFKFNAQMPRLQDYELVIRMAAKYTFFYLKEPLVDLYLQNDSLTRSTEKSLVAFELILKNDAYIFDRYPKRKAEILNMLGNLKVDNGDIVGGKNCYMAAFNSRKNLKYLFKGLKISLKRINSI